MIQLPQNLAAVNWQFDTNFDSIILDFIIHDDPTSSRGLFFQFYDGRINEAGMYFGIQTNAFQPNVGFVGGAVIFSRWGSSDEKNIRVPENGFIQNSAHEGQFIGVRKPIILQTGKYRIEVKKVETDESGEWYNISIQFENKLPIDCGSLQFPFSMKKGFDDGGGTWVELYSTGERGNQIDERDIPHQVISITNIVAGKTHKPKNVQLKYPYEKESCYSKVTFDDGVTIFEVGADVQRE